ncbi:MAG: hypothetical protein LBI49_23505 [Nocardiopsaceae bacterium]|jgi:hypothetical protein|nr:hypothetical protein [Nocardiopsaceae bacterium]
MRVGTGLSLLAIGAILAFAVSGSPPYWNLQITGVVLIATGLAALLIPRQSYGWLRRKMVVRPGSRRSVVTRRDETSYSQPSLRYQGPRPAPGEPAWDGDNPQVATGTVVREPWPGDGSETIEEFRRE